MSKAKNPKGRWIKGNERYGKNELSSIVSKYHEQQGWHKGARLKGTKPHERHYR